MVSEFKMNLCTDS